MKTFPSVHQIEPEGFLESRGHPFSFRKITTSIRALVLSALLLFLGQLGIAQTVFFELSAEPGNQSSSTGTSNSANFSAPILTRGAGVTATTGAGSMNASGWYSSGTPTTIDDAIANNDYYEFTVNTLNCFFFNPTTINIVLRSSATGPGLATLRSSADGFGADIGTVNITTTSTEYAFSDVISPNSQSTTFRLYGYGAAAGGGTPSAGGTLRIGSSVVASDQDIKVFATTTFVNVAQVSNITVTDGDNVPATVFNTNVPGATVNWTRTPEDIASPDLPTGGTGDLPSFIADNNTNSPTTTTVTVNAAVGNCTGPNMVFTITVNPPPCTITTIFSGSASPCNDNGTPNDPSDDFYTMNVQGAFFNRPTTGNLQIVPSADVIGTYSIPVSQIVGNSHIFTGVKFRADGNQTEVEMNFTDLPTCIDGATRAGVASCSTPPPACTITATFSGSPSACNDNGTPNDPSDDFYTHNVQGTFFNRPTTGNLQIVPGGDVIGTYSIPVSQIIGNLHIFTGVKFRADGNQTEVEINFTAEPTCIDGATRAGVASCSASAPSCEIIGYSFANIGPCNDNGTPNNDTDDFFTVNVEVIYSNALTGAQISLGDPDVVSSPSVPVAIGTNLTVTLVGVQFRADGQAVEFTGIIFDSFGNGCSLFGTGPAVNECSNGGGVCDITSVTLQNIGPCDDNGTNDPTDDFFPANVVISWVNRPATGLLQIEPGGDAITTHNVAVAGLPASGSHTFTNVHFKADGTQTVVEAEFTIPANTCVQTTTGPTVAPCSPVCDITNVTLQNVGTCNRNGTPNDPSDDFFPADVLISWVNRLDTGLLQIEPGGDAITIHNVAVAGLPVNGSHTFTNVRFKADNTVTVVEVEFTVPANVCTQTIGGPTVAPCPCPQVTFLPPPPNQTVECDGSGNIAQFNAWLAAGGFANVNPSSGTITSITHGTPVVQNNCGNTKTFTVLFTFTNDCGNSANIGGVFTIADNTPPVITSGVIGSCYPTAAAAQAAALSITTAIDGCGGTVTFNAIASGTCTAIVTVTASDLCGNSTTHTYATRIDNTPPTITCAAQTTPIECPATPVFTPPSATDNCPGNIAINFGDVTVQGACPGTYTTTRTWTATDPCGNTATCARSITVRDMTPPPVPANGASQVACPALAIAPVPPTVIDACAGAITPTGPVILNNPNPLTCEGTRTFTFTYRDCSGNTSTWSHVTTIEREPFTITTPNGNLTVDCPDDTDTAPTPPIVTSNCGEVLTPVLINTTAKPGCEGHRVYTFRYTDCEGNFADWLFTYQVEYQDFAVPPSELESVECPILASEPVPPVVFDNCGNLLTPIGPAVASSTNAQGCEGSRSYSWTYKDCEGNTHVWSKTYDFLYSADFEVFSDETNVVACISYAVEPFPPTFYDACGNLVKVALTGFSEDIALGGCTGWRRYDFTYTNCGGHTRPWSFTYEINDNEAPLGTCPSGNGGTSNGNAPVTVSVTNLSCIGDVPCPDDYDFSGKVEELLEAGNFFDVCSGADLIVELQGSSDLWQCADPDGDGEFTFGRTFYFRIADLCGNEYPGGCEVTYSGECLPIETFRQEAWGIPGGAPGSFMNATDLIIIEDMLAYGPVVVGGPNRSLTIDDPQCVVNMLPGTSGPSTLANCHQVNCTGTNGASCNPMGIGGMKNSLAANAIALTLNLRFNVEYKGLEMSSLRNEGLSCIEVHECITDCSATACHLRFFDQNGGHHQFPYTLGGLLDMANLFLDGGLPMTIGQKTLYGTALNQSLMNVNDYWAKLPDTACSPSAGAPSGDEAAKQLPLPDVAIAPQHELDFQLSPNPAGSEVTFTLPELADNQAVVFELYNTLGQLVLRKDFGNRSQVHERIDLRGVKNGLYFAKLKVGRRQLEKRLVVGRD